MNSTGFRYLPTTRASASANWACTVAVSCSAAANAACSAATSPVVGAAGAGGASAGATGARDVGAGATGAGGAGAGIAGAGDADDEAEDLRAPGSVRRRVRARNSPGLMGRRSAMEEEEFAWSREFCEKGRKEEIEPRGTR